MRLSGRRAAVQHAFGHWSGIAFRPHTVQRSAPQMEALVSVSPPRITVSTTASFRFGTCSSCLRALGEESALGTFQLFCPAQRANHLAPCGRLHLRRPSPLRCRTYLFAPALCVSVRPGKSAAFRSIAEGLESVPFLGRIPVVDDHLHWHSTTPDTGRALGVISPGVQTPMSMVAIGFQVRRFTMERWTSQRATFSIFQRLQTACLVESGRLKPRIRNGNRLPTCLHACVEKMLRLGGLPERNLEFVGFISNCPDNAKHVSLVAVTSLVERPHQPDTRLHGYDPPGP